MIRNVCIFLFLACSAAFAGEPGVYFYKLGKEFNKTELEANSNSRFFYELVKYLNLANKNEIKTFSDNSFSNKTIVYVKQFSPIMKPYEDVGVTWGKCAQNKKAFYVFFHDKPGLELRGFVSLKTQGELDVTGLMLTRKFSAKKLQMDLSMTSKVKTIGPTLLDTPKVETSLKFNY